MKPARFLKARDIAEMFGMDIDTVREKTATGEIPGFKTGKARNSPYRYDPVQIELLIARWKRESAA